MESTKGAQEAIQKLDGFQIVDKTLRVSVKKSKEEKFNRERRKQVKFVLYLDFSL